VHASKNALYAKNDGQRADPLNGAASLAL
jgi:hypothetical protein